MNSFEVAKAIHVVALVFWIGGVTFVTFILIPAIRRLDHIQNQYDFFEKIESKFALQAKVTTLLTGVSGFYMVEKLDAWDRFTFIEYWWMHAMVIIWLLFTVMLFVLEPFFLHKFFKEQSVKNPKGLMKKIQDLHILLSVLSIFTIIGVMIGVH